MLIVLNYNCISLFLRFSQLRPVPSKAARHWRGGPGEAALPGQGSWRMVQAWDRRGQMPWRHPVHCIGKIIVTVNLLLVTCLGLTPICFCVSQIWPQIVAALCSFITVLTPIWFRMTGSCEKPDCQNLLVMGQQCWALHLLFDPRQRILESAMQQKSLSTLPRGKTDFKRPSMRTKNFLCNFISLIIGLDS